MRNLILASLVPLWLATTSHAGEVWIGIDFSDSVPLLLEDDVALRAGRTISSKVRSLGQGDRVYIQSFGEAGISERQIHIEARMEGRTRPRAVARDLEKLTASMPAMVREGRLRVEQRTNAMGWLERVGPLLRCETVPTTVILFTDAIEWSGAIDGNALLQGAPLPPPSGAILRGCHVEFWGVGQQQKQFGNDDRWYPILHRVWDDWMQVAQVASFQAYADYGR